MLQFIILQLFIISSLISTICNALAFDPNASPSANKPILVIGATGKLGRCVVSKLQERNIRHRCLARKSSQNIDRIIQNISENNDIRTIYEGDLANYDDVRNAVCSDGGIDGCICVSGSFRKRKASDTLLPFRGGKMSITDSSHPYIVNHIGMQNLCKAMNELGENDAIEEDTLYDRRNTPKIVKVSGALLSLPRWHYISIIGNILYSGVMRWHREGEKDIIDSGIPYTILRPGSFRDGEEYGELKEELVVDEDGALRPTIKVKKPIIGINDLADVCIECLESSNKWDNKILYPKWVVKDNV